MVLGIQMDYTDLPEDLGKKDVALPPQSARIESRWVQLKHLIEELLGGRMSIEKTFNVIFPLGIVPKKALAIKLHQTANPPPLREALQYLACFL